MAAFAIMRAKKLASMGSVAASLQHCYRDRETPNADADRTPANEHRAARGTDEAMGKLRELLPEKRRKDAVLAIEYVMTASPEWWEKATPAQQADFFDRSQRWLADKYGADRVIVATVHQDETSPHLSAFVVPLTKDGRLSAKEFIGDRTKMRKDQTTYAESVRDLGLVRGIEGSRAKHQSIQQYYAAIERGGQPLATITPTAVEPRVLRKGLFSSVVETPEVVAERLTKAVNEGFSGTIAMASTAAQERRRAKDMQDTANDLRKRLDGLTGAFKGLTKDQMTQVLKLAMTYQQENATAKQQSKAIRLQRGRTDPDKGRSR